MIKLIITALSDTHGHHKKLGTLPETDVLVFAGDLMTSGYDRYEVASFAKWWNSQTHRAKILIAGNHDRLFETNPFGCLIDFERTAYLNDTGITLNGFKFWGSPVQPAFCNWAFNVERGKAIKKHWDKIPDDTDCLITHGPPFGILDESKSEWADNGPLGCEELWNRVNKLPNLQRHIFGHIHDGYGSTKSLDYYGANGQVITHFNNVAICNEQYQPVNAPQVFTIEK